MDSETVGLELDLVEPDEPADDPFYIEPEGMVYTALRELGACLVAVEQGLPEPD